MKNRINRVKNSQSGFSLVELMVVVVIIGILSAIAVPSINKQIARARQSEAKTNLSSIYTAEKSFYTEYNTFTGVFNAIGYRPEGELRYNVGFGSAGIVCATLATYGYNGACTNTSISTQSLCPAHTAAAVAGGAVCTLKPEGFGKVLTGGTRSVTPTVNTFRAAAVADIVTSGTPDVWTINENKQVRNTEIGIP